MKKSIFMPSVIHYIFVLFFMLNAAIAAADTAAIKPLHATETSKIIVSAAHVQININTASVKELAALSGMNSSKARAIVAWRKKNGAFTSLDVLHNVSGFKRLSDEKWQVLVAQLTLNKP